MRRKFLGRLLGGAMAVGATSAVPRELWAEPEPDAGDGGLGLARDWEAGQAQAPVWDMTWVDRISGQYRQVFDAPAIEEGTVLHQTRTFIRGYADVYGAKDSEFSAVMVIRHAAIAMAVNDRLWDELELGKSNKVKDPESGKSARRNPFLNANAPASAKYSMLWPDGGLDTLLKRGAIGLCCNLALFQIVGMVAKRDGSDPKAAREKVLANLVPGIIVQPSGIFAVARAQQAGCHYIRAA